jgi:SAM-dependent methyltransferase
MDLAPIPLLWVLPLGLYLLTFILVFSRVPAWVHQGMLIAMPLLVLLVLFLMLADLRRIHIQYNIALHLLTLFVVAMVCHGELARDRPATKHLTGFYLWMSLGGVLGGLFNGLVAPLAFYGLVDYPLALLAACLLLPPATLGEQLEGGRRVDLILAGVCVTFGALLMGLGVKGEVPAFHVLRERPGLYWLWPLAALLAGVGLPLAVVLRTREGRSERWLDLTLPVCLGVLALGLLWGVPSAVVWPRVRSLADVLHTDTKHLRVILTYGVPAVLCYTFVERPLRFGLGVGAILLATCINGLLDENLLLQSRSFFGVLRVEASAEVDSVRVGDEVQQVRYDFRSLIHGTTLHGKECFNEGYRDEPLTYYHHTGPIGQVFEAYNADARRNLAVVGLGTGTMACYARKGQELTFYDIDPAVRSISYDTDRYFDFVEDARNRGAHVDLVMGDARLTMERQQLDEKDRYGILVVDAFSSDAIPIHLITREALQMFLDRLAPDGILAFHISNRYLDLGPVLANLAQDANLAGLIGEDEDESYPGKARSTWVMLARKPQHLGRIVAPDQFREDILPLVAWPDQGTGLARQAWLLHQLVDPKASRNGALVDSMWTSLKSRRKKAVGIWTDDYSNLLRVLSW